MYYLIKSIKIRELFIVEIPSFIVALCVAEAFYKFGSFTLELLMFVPTWFVIGAVVAFLGRQIGILHTSQDR